MSSYRPTWDNSSEFFFYYIGILYDRPRFGGRPVHIHRGPGTGQMKIECGHCSKVHMIPDRVARKRRGKSVLQCRSCKKEFEFDFTARREDKAREDARTPAHDLAVASADNLKARILSQVEALSPMPQVAQKAQEILEDEGSSFKDIVDIIEMDQAIAARVLKIANSPYYSAGKEITSLQQAAVMLGTKTLQEYLTLSCASSVLGHELEGYALDTGGLWQHSLAVATCAQRIAEANRPELRNDAFSAGLIHDCGKLVLAPYVAEKQESFSQHLADGRTTFLEAEKAILGFDHAEIGGEVCEHWGIPARIAQPIRYHHDPASSGGDELAGIVHAADAIALMSGLGVGADGIIHETDAGVRKRLALDEKTVADLILQSLLFVKETLAAF